MSQEQDRKAEAAHGGVVRRSGDIATLGDGSQWWLNGAPWARAGADAVIARNRVHVGTTGLEGEQ